MYFKTYTSINPDTGQLSGYHRLVELYRDVWDCIYHWTKSNGVVNTVRHQLKTGGTNSE